MKKKVITVGIIVCITIVASIYFSIPSPIAKDPDEVQIHWVRVLDSNLEEQNITAHIDCEKLAQIICSYDRSKIPYHFAPYQMAIGDIEIGYFDHGELKLILLGSVDVVYESADKGGYKIYNKAKLQSEIQKMFDDAEAKL